MFRRSRTIVPFSSPASGEAGQQHPFQVQLLEKQDNIALYLLFALCLASPNLAD
ncbi:hypothetical protein [Algoriphagus taiwanensis]|uniref:hypothetical protein n=1 Tax=Algoriphagus taiwanensis TaxID=1445656 RepID=UPI0030C6B4EA